MDIKNELSKLAPTRPSRVVIALLLLSIPSSYAILWSLNEAWLQLDSQSLEKLRISAIVVLVLVSSVFLNIHLILEMRSRQIQHQKNIEMVTKTALEIGTKNGIEAALKEPDLEEKLRRQLGIT